MKIQSMQETLQALKEAYPTSDDPLDENAALTYYMDQVNKMAYEYAELHKYELTLIKYGVRMGGSLGWGRPTKVTRNEIELKELESDPHFKILKKKSLGMAKYEKIIGKTTPEGVFVPAKKQYHFMEREDENPIR